MVSMVPDERTLFELPPFLGGINKAGKNSVQCTLLSSDSFGKAVLPAQYCSTSQGNTPVLLRKYCDIPVEGRSKQ